MELPCCLEASHQPAGRTIAVLCELGGFAPSSWLCKVVALQESDLEQVMYVVGTLLFPEPMPVVEQKFHWLAAKIHFHGWFLASWSLHSLREGSFISG